MRVTLAPGDLLLSASTVLFGAAPAAPEARLASCEDVCTTSYPIAGYDCAEPTPVSPIETEFVTRCLESGQHTRFVWLTIVFRSAGLGE